MPVTCASAIAAGPDTAAAFRGAATRLRAALPAAPDFLLLHADARHDPAALMRAAAQEFPGVAVMGGSSCRGVMTDTRCAIGEAEPALGLFAVHDPAGAFGVGAATLGNDARAAAAAAAEAALAASGRGWEAPALAWLCAAPGQEGAVIEGIQDALGAEVPILGGSSADNDVAGGWWQLGAGQALRDGVVVAVLFPSGRLGHAFQSGYEPAGPRGRATLVEGREIVEIEGTPAATAYGTWTGGRLAVPAGEVRTILGQSTWAPLARDMGEVEGLPFLLLAHPAQTTARGGLTVFADVPEGAELRLMAGTEQGLLSRIGRVALEAADAAALPPQAVAGALAIYCGGCMLAVQPRMDEVAGALRGALPDVPFLGGFTFGEQGRSVTGANLHGNLMISVVVFGA
jgi:hypothetical protein